MLKGGCCDRPNRACCRPVAHHGAKSGACFLHAGMQPLELLRKNLERGLHMTVGGVRYLECTFWAESETRSTAVQIASSIQHGEGLVALSRFTIHTKN